MHSSKLIFWNRSISALIVGLGIGWMAWELVRVFWQITATSGPAAALRDGVTLHKIGELLIIIPFMSVVLRPTFGRPDRDFSAALMQRLRLAMLAGALLNGYAWLELRQRVEWHSWCLILLAAGVAGALTLAMISRAISRQAQRKAAGNRKS